MSFLTHLECARCGKTYSGTGVYNLCECGSTLFARYDLRRAASKLDPKALRSRASDLWRYREVLPVANGGSIQSLGEGFTPLLRARRLGDKLGLPNLYLKDESQNPTGSFKARGMAVAVSKAHELGIHKLAVPRREMPAAPWRLMVRRLAWRRQFSCRKVRPWPTAWNARCTAPR